MPIPQTTSILSYPILGDLAFIDLKTTGLRPNKDKIIGIAITVLSAGEIKNRWNQFINPQKKMSSHTQHMTGITHDLVKKAPSFAEIALELNTILKNKTLVAYNVEFVYGFLKNELLNVQIDLNEKTLCTTKLSRLLFPELKQHAMNAIQKHLNLEIEKNSAIFSDIELMMEFFKKIPEFIALEDLSKMIDSLIQQPIISSVATLQHKNNIPDSHGIYRFYDEKNILLYIGKSTSLQKRIFSHFKKDNNSYKEIQLSAQVKKVDWIETVGEMGSLLLESIYIKKYMPIFNRLLKKSKPLFTIQSVINKNNYTCLQIVNLSEVKVKNLMDTYEVFTHKKDAEVLLKNLIRENSLCYHINNFVIKKGACFRHQINKCYGACDKKESADEYNSRILMALEKLDKNIWPYKGKISIRENCAATNKEEFHLFDKWTYLDTVKAVNHDTYSCIENEKIDIDIYKILTRFLSKEDNHLYIREI